jgi:myosin heavy subunit
MLEKTRSVSNLFSADQNLITNASNLVYFNVSISELIAKIEFAKPVFIKCIKPNENSFSSQFVAQIAGKQIRESGLVEFARVRKLNYPVKIEFGLFVKRSLLLFSSIF